MLNKFYFGLDITKSRDEEGKFIVEGYASTPTLDRQNEIITRKALEGAVEELLKFGTTVFFNHDYNRPIGKLLSGEVDDRGLRVTLSVSEAEQELRTKIKEGIVSKFSVGGRVTSHRTVSRKEAEQFVEDEIPNDIKNVVIIDGLSLFEVSLVGLPANPQAAIENVFIKSLGTSIRELFQKEVDKMEDEKRVEQSEDREKIEEKKTVDQESTQETPEKAEEKIEKEESSSDGKEESPSDEKAEGEKTELTEEEVKDLVEDEKDETKEEEKPYYYYYNNSKKIVKALEDLMKDHADMLELLREIKELVKDEEPEDTKEVIDPTGDNKPEDEGKSDRVDNTEDEKTSEEKKEEPSAKETLIKPEKVEQIKTKSGDEQFADWLRS